ncbi:MAG: hypothetical protein WB116_07290 [Candidatus Dormiibacterota bacterium]
MAVLVALLLGVAVIGSWAAWVISDGNANNSFATNTILLDDNQGGQDRPPAPAPRSSR